MTTTSVGSDLQPQVARLADALVRWLETGVRAENMFTDDVFLDLSTPQWRRQEQGLQAVVDVRETDHPWPGTVRVEALDATSRGFLMQFAESWNDGEQQWYCREVVHCAIAGGRITELFVSCTGDWDAALQRRHAAEVRLIRP